MVTRTNIGDDWPGLEKEEKFDRIDVRTHSYHRYSTYFYTSTSV